MCTLTRLFRFFKFLFCLISTKKLWSADFIMPLCLLQSRCECMLFFEYREERTFLNKCVHMERKVFYYQLYVHISLTNILVFILNI